MLPDKILITDIGGAQVKTILLAKSGADYQLIGQSACASGPQSTVMSDLERTIRRIETDVGVTPESFMRADDQEILHLASCTVGGPLRLLALGISGSGTKASARQAVLGTGAILLDTLTVDDGRLRVETAERIRQLSPDAVLLLGGFDGAALSALTSLAEVLALTEVYLPMPVLFAGNSQAHGLIKGLLGAKTELHLLPNLMPAPGRENLTPTRLAISDLNYRHLVGPSSDLALLGNWADMEILPSPLALSRAASLSSPQSSLLAVDIGAAATSIISVSDGGLACTQTAVGLGPGSITTIQQIRPTDVQRWLETPVPLVELLDSLANRCLHSSTEVSQQWPLRGAWSRELLRLALLEHLQLAPGQLAGREQPKPWWEALGPTAPPAVCPARVVGTGELFSSYLTSAQAALLLLDGVQPEGVTELAIDGGGIWSHLGALSAWQPDVASGLLAKSLQLLCTAISPVGSARSGHLALTVRLTLANGAKLERAVRFGEILVIPDSQGQQFEAELRPEKEFDVGAGPGVSISRKLQGGSLGLFLDGRGRNPLVVSPNLVERQRQLRQWQAAVSGPRPWRRAGAQSVR